MNFLPKNYLTTFIKFYELIIVIILILNQVSSSVPIGNNKGPTQYLYDRTNYDYISQVLRRPTRQTVNNDGNCEIPIIPSSTTYTSVGGSERTYRSGDIVRQFNIIQTNCSDGYNLNYGAFKSSYCINGIWSPPLAVCIRTCPSLISTKTTTVKCRYNNSLLKNCINPIKGTTAFLSCNPLYEEPSLQRNPIRVCREGRWDRFVPQCSPICGVKHPKGKVNLIGGRDVMVGDYPWQVGIYRSSDRELICGGSIIEENILLSAAHCFTDYDGNVHPVGNYLVAAGKYFRAYNDEKDLLAQYSNISEIHVPEMYKGTVTVFSHDIAILILSDPFTLSESIQPVCIALNVETQNLDLSLNSNGVVTGWGYTEEGMKPSDVLKELVVPYISFNKCFNEVPTHFRRYLTFDKICGGFISNGMSVCSGDSGGGLVFNNTLNDRYFIRGIVSTSPTVEGDVLACDSNQYSTFTSITHHINFIRDLVALYQLQRPIECIYEDDCVNEEISTEGNEQEQRINEQPSGCQLPDNPPHGEYSLNKNHSYDYAFPSVTIVLTCEINYIVYPLEATHSYCRYSTDQWVPPLGKCELCENTVTEVNGKSTCKGKLIFEENFENGINLKWKRELKFSKEPDYNFVMYHNLDGNLGISDNQLHITPSLTENTYGKDLEQLNLGENCTGKLGTSDCQQRQENIKILPPVISAQISTKNNFSFRYGIVEIRAKLPEGDWIYPELYLMNKNNDYGPGLQSGLIRIALTKGNLADRNILSGGCVLGGTFSGRQAEIKNVFMKKPWTDDFHTFTVVWEPDRITVGVDNNEYGYIVPPNDGFANHAKTLFVDIDPEVAERWKQGSPLAPFDKEMYLVIGVGVGGFVFSGKFGSTQPWRNGDANAQYLFNADKNVWSNTWNNRSSLIVDYVRVWSLSERLYY